jgi:threonine/homoserine/homoserine lactone efflux protein
MEVSPVSLVPLLAKGFLLGLSVAWPPGPINAEMLRRGIARGFAPAFALGAGACSGDFLWALAVTFGAGSIAGRPGVRPVMGAASVLLLAFLGAMFLRGAVARWRRHRRGEPSEEPRLLDSTRGGFLLGLGMALSSPWNVAFWIAVVGSGPASLPIPVALLFAGGVLAGALTWGLLFCSAIRFGFRSAGPAWQIGTEAATGLLLLFFSVRTLLRLAA